jgi:uncharacterized protein (TIGR00369 family)
MSTADAEPFATSIAPWLAVSDARAAVDFYRAAFGAVELYRLDGDDGSLAVAQLSVGGAVFWVQDDNDASPEAQRTGSVRMILSVEDPDTVFDQAVAAGAAVVAPVAEAYGWRTGRVTDPFGYDWEPSKFASMTTSEPSVAAAGWGAPRSKTVSWHDPALGAATAPSMSGLDYLRAIVDGALPDPPIAHLMGIRMVSVSEGDAVFACTPDESVYNPIGSVHGGLVCTLLDSVAGCAVHSTLPAGVAYASIEIKVNYVRGIHVQPSRPIELTAHGWVTKPGRRVAFAEGDVRDAAGTLFATASSACLIYTP